MTAPCDTCPLGATRAVASRGPVPARLFFLSGAPRYHEEHDGVAFASPAFAQLEEMLADAGLDPASVHYATLTGCRPPYQRPIRAEEIAACAPRLETTIAAAQPDVVVLCGHEALAGCLPGAIPGNSRGKLIQSGRYLYYPIRHPYAALHTQGYIDELMADLRRLATLLEQELPPDEIREEASPSGAIAASGPEPLVEPAISHPLADNASGQAPVAEDAGTMRLVAAALPPEPEEDGVLPAPDGMPAESGILDHASVLVNADALSENVTAEQMGMVEPVEDAADGDASGDAMQLSLF